MRFVYAWVIAALSLVTQLGAEEPVFFVDIKLKTAVEASLGVSDPTPTQMLLLHSFTAGFKGITDLTGLEYATNLTSLDLEWNQISDLSPLAGLISLVEVRIDAGDPNSPLDWESAPRGDRINLGAYGGTSAASRTYITVPPMSDNIVQFGDTRLKQAVEKTLERNDPTAHDMLALITLKAGFAGITDLTGLEYAHKLRVLDLEWNQIVDLSPLSQLTSLVELRIPENRVFDLSPLAGLTHLEIVDFHRNYSIDDLSPLSNLLKVRELVMRNNNIAYVTGLENMINLEVVYLQGNSLYDLTELTHHQKIRGSLISIPCSW